MENSATDKQFFLKAISNTAAKASRAGPVRGAQGGNFRGRFRSAGISNCLQRFTPGVLSDMTMPHHPIEVGIRNVCELSRAKKLQTLKLSELKELCESLQLAVVGSLARKKSFIEPLETYAKTCTCFQT